MECPWNPIEFHGAHMEISGASMELPRITSAHLSYHFDYRILYNMEN